MRKNQRAVLDRGAEGALQQPNKGGFIAAAESKLPSVDYSLDTNPAYGLTAVNRNQRNEHSMLQEGRVHDNMEEDVYAMCI